MSERYTVARMTHDGEHFEILVKPQLAFSYRLGKTSSDRGLHGNGGRNLHRLEQ